MPFDLPGLGSSNRWLAMRPARAIYLVDSKDGHPLDAKIGPLALVIPGDKAPARWARKVVSIEVQ